ncbi:MAG: SDR family oxidoreductase [Ardenticatenales bacterium]|nr:SDR family oxidoreductase [Ardenticatenales bacterium]
MARLILTGATGLLGRNVLFEVLKQSLRRGERHMVVVLGRASGDRSLRQRVMDMLSTDGADYIFGEDRPPAIDLDALLSQVRCVEADAVGRAGDPIVQIGELPGGARGWDALVHCAGQTSFRTDSETARRVLDVNFGGAQRVTALAGQIELGKLVFVGSAYSAGRMAGTILPDDLDLAGSFANPYQRSKAAAERVVRDFAELSGLDTVVVRPSTIGGRLIEERIGAVPTFAVFYEWAARMLRFKIRAMGPGRPALDEWHRLPLRFHIARGSGLHIVPADYCAKLIVHAALHPTPDRAIHLAPERSTPHELYVRRMLDWIKVAGVEFVGERPADLDRFERHYYRTLGDMFDPYVTVPAIHFDLGATRRLEQAAGIACPVVDGAAFDRLMAYAVERGLGVPEARGDAEATVASA